MLHMAEKRPPTWRDSGAAAPKHSKVRLTKGTAAAACAAAEAAAAMAPLAVPQSRLPSRASSVKEYMQHMSPYDLHLVQISRERRLQVRQNLEAALQDDPHLFTTHTCAATEQARSADPQSADHPSADLPSEPSASAASGSTDHPAAARRLDAGAMQAGRRITEHAGRMTSNSESESELWADVSDDWAGGTQEHELKWLTSTETVVGRVHRQDVAHTAIALRKHAPSSAVAASSVSADLPPAASSAVAAFSVIPPTRFSAVAASSGSAGPQPAPPSAVAASSGSADLPPASSSAAGPKQSSRRYLCANHFLARQPTFIETEHEGIWHLDRSW